MTVAGVIDRYITSMSNEQIEDLCIDDLCKDCGPTFSAFLEQMATHNAEQMAAPNPKVICPTCGKVHEYTPDASKVAGPRAS